MELVVSRRVCENPTSWSFHCHWDEQVFWWLNSQFPMWIRQIISDLNPNMLALVWVYQWFFILFPNHKPCPKPCITTSPESSVNTVTPVHKGTFAFYVYYGRNGYTFQYSEVNDIGWKLALKQWVSSWLSILVADAPQINLSWFVCTFLIIRRPPVLMLNTALFTFPSRTRFSSQYFVTRFPRGS